MAIPDFQTVMLPLLQFAADQQEKSLREAVAAISDKFNLSDDERVQRIPSGGMTTIMNRVGWASTYLRKAELLELTRRGYFKITPLGLEILEQSPQRINLKFLSQFEGVRKFRTRTQNDERQDGDLQAEAENLTRTPEEIMDEAFQNIKEGLASDLLQRIKSCSPAFFEQLVIDLLVTMGYGGTRKDAGRAVGRSGDGGIDGIINEDRLGLDVIYVQAKRWDGIVGRPEIQKFAGALQGQRAKKGIFITTSAFTREARDYALFIETRIILIDGETLADLMISYKVGVNTQVVYELKKIDLDYFAEE